MDGLTLVATKIEVNMIFIQFPGFMKQTEKNMKKSIGPISL